MKFADVNDTLLGLCDIFNRSRLCERSEAIWSTYFKYERNYNALLNTVFALMQSPDCFASLAKTILKQD